MSSRIVIERIATEAELYKGATIEDVTFVEQFGAESRRREVLAWRRLVRRELGDKCQISHDEYGAPKVDVPATNISVSHSKEYVALVISDNPCAIDIESTERDFCKVTSRYLSSLEFKLAEQYDLFAEIWCAKEALYKLYSKGALDFVNDISIVDYKPDEGVLIATILRGEPINVQTFCRDGLAVAVIAN